MLMFRFWGSDSRGSDKSEQVLHRPMHDFAKPVHSFVSETTTVTSPPRPPKRRRQSNAAIATQSAAPLPALKRQRVDDVVDEKSPKRAKVAAVAPVVPPPTAVPVATPTRAGEGSGSAKPPPPSPQQQQQSQQSRPKAAAVAAPDLERAQETIEHEFSVAILHKHNELRLINQELAKCQVALEQLRRCHLIPYPVNVPTPEQMLNISNGTGPALQSKPGEKVPEWAPPFGVTDGPYARHYAKWLIPDPKFDGIVPDTPLHAESARGRKGVESRSTRNSIGDVGGIPGKGRPSRGMASQKLHALPNGYAQPKDKAGPCILKRADGKTVKLVCIDCKRDNFSSTQGFINHCRIAHKRDFKSHEEAAVACGHPIEVDVNAGGGEEKATAASANSSSSNAATTTPAATAVGHSHSSSVGGSTSLAPGLVHPLARGSALSESEACFSVVSRIKESMDMYRKGQMQGFSSIPGVSSTLPPAMKARKDSDFSPSVESPHLSRLLESRGKTMNLGELVRDAKTKVNLDDVMSPDGESDDGDSAPDSLPADPPRMRVPARTTAKSPVPPPSVTRPASSKGRGHTVPYVTPVPTPASRLASEQEAELPPMVDEMDLDLSPNTAVSINAPSLVSDDGEYDDSVDGSSDESEANDGLDAESMSDVAEIGFDDDHMRSLRHHRGSTTGDSAVRFRKEDNKHVTFVGTVKEKESQKQRNRPVK